MHNFYYFAANSVDFVISTDLKSLILSYEAMSIEDQEEFTKLHNRFEKLEDLELTAKQKEFATKSNQDILKIYGIYRTNSFENGVAINFARFNHSCCSNAEAIWNEEENASEIRAVSKIKRGEEITLTYNWKQLAMKEVKTRQDNLWYNWGFKCCCEVCQAELEQTDVKIYKMFAKLQEEIKTCLKKQHLITDKEERLENIKKEVFCHKQLYKLAKDKKCSRMFIVNEILDDAFNAAAQGYITAQMSYKVDYLQTFKKDCQLLAVAGEQLSKILGSTSSSTYLEWDRRKNEFDEWIKDVKASIREHQQQNQQINWYSLLSDLS